MTVPSESHWSGPASSRRLAGMLLASLVATVLFFLLSAMVANRLERGITRASESVADNSLPSIQHIAGARTALRQMEVLLIDLTQEAGSARRPEGALAELESTRQLLDRECRSYLALPSYRGEEELRAEIRAALRLVQGRVDDVLARLRAGDDKGARSTRNAGGAFELGRLDEALHAALELNAVRGAELSKEITSIKKRSARLELWLYGLSALFSVVAGLLVVHVVRRLVRLAELRVLDLERFAGRVAHDIRSPLSSIGTTLELTLRDQTLEGKARARLERSSATVRRIGQLVDGILVFAVAGGPPPEGASADVRRAITGVIDEMQPGAGERNIELRVETTDAGAVACSPGVLTSVLTNLVGNALKYLGETAVRRVDVRAQDLGSKMRIEVRDTGPGISKELRERIFDPYVRRPVPEGASGAGLGLGLATTRRLVEAHGGSIGVGETPEGGSLFWFQLPKAA